MLKYKAGYKYVDGGVHAQVLDFPAAITCARDLDEARRLLGIALVDVAEAAATDCLGTGDPAGARWAARQGLAVAEYEERLWRPLMRAAHDESGVAAMEAVFDECAQALEVTVEPFDSLQPETIELYLRLGGRRRATRPDRSTAIAG